MADAGKMPSWGALYLRRDERSLDVLRPKLEVLQAAAPMISRDVAGWLQAVHSFPLKYASTAARVSQSTILQAEDTVKRLVLAEIPAVLKGNASRELLARFRSDFLSMHADLQELIDQVSTIPLDPADNQKLASFKVVAALHALGNAWRVMEEPPKSEMRETLEYGAVETLKEVLAHTQGPVGLLVAAGVREVQKLAVRRRDAKQRAVVESLGAASPPEQESAAQKPGPQPASPSGTAPSGGGLKQSTFTTGSAGLSVSSRPSPPPAGPPPYNPPPGPPPYNPPAGPPPYTGPVEPPPKATVRPTPAVTGEGLRGAGAPPPARPGPPPAGPPPYTGPIDRDYASEITEQRSPVPPTAPSGGAVSEPVIVSFPPHMMGTHGLKCDILESLVAAGMNGGGQGASTGSGGMSSLGKLKSAGGWLRGAAGRLGGAGRAGSLALRAPVGSAAAGGAAGATAGVAAAGLAGWTAGKMLDDKFKISDTWGKRAMNVFTRDRSVMSDQQAKEMDRDSARLKAERGARPGAVRPIVEVPPAKPPEPAPEAASRAAATTATADESAAPGAAAEGRGAHQTIIIPPSAPQQSNFREGTSVDDPLLEFLNMGRLAICTG